MASLEASSTLCLLLLLMVQQYFSLRLHAAALPRAFFFVFGDSLVDAGNNNYLFTLSKADSPPYGVDFAPSGGKPTGRFTNGRTTLDIIVQALGGRSFPLPYLAVKDMGDKVEGGVNYASGSSGILDETGSSFIERIPLRKQVSYFEETKGYMVRMWGENATDEMLKKAIFSITTGSNDILNYLEPFEPFITEQKLSPAALQESMISNLTSHIKRLHSLGARKFLVNGIGPLGCIPYVRANVLMAKHNKYCTNCANMIAQGYNVQMSKRINELNQELGPETIFVYAKSYEIVMEIIQNSRRHGFENANDPCCGVSFPPFLCSTGDDEKSTSVLCRDRAKYVFWDAYHPTEATNIIIANKLLDDDDASYTSPINVRKLFDGMP